MRFSRRFLWLCLFLLAAMSGMFFWYRANTPKSSPSYGATFSVMYAEELGLDWRTAYVAAQDELGVRKFRLPVNWDRVEKADGSFDWSEIDWMVAESEKRGTELVMAIGRKTPRWPECHIPEWAATLSKGEQDRRVLRLLAETVRRYKDEKSVVMWQVENEPLFHFGKCPPPDREFLKQEIALVRAADSRPVMITDSGELSTWIRTGTLSDVLGISMYRLVWNKDLGQLYWPVSPFYYADRMRLLSPILKRVIVSELQAEPWFREPVQETPLSEQLDQMNAKRLKDNAEYAASTGAGEIYFWGLEWWYWLLLHGRPELWNSAKPFFAR